MQNFESIDYLNKIIYTKRGIKKAMDHASKRAMFKNNYNKGYLEALNDELKCLTELRSLRRRTGSEIRSQTRLD